MGKNSQKNTPVMTEIEHSVWLIMSSDDYRVIMQDDTHADLVHVHTGAIISITLLMPAWKS